jgi:hypothetical protein
MEFSFTIRDLLWSMVVVGVGLTVYRVTAVLASGIGHAAVFPVLALLWFGLPASIVAGGLSPLIGSRRSVHAGLILQLFCVASLASAAATRLLAR